MAAQEIERLTVTRTERDSTHLRPYAERERDKDQDSSVVVFPPIPIEQYIIDMGEDVTDEFITGAPGEDQEALPDPTGETNPAVDAREVFVVHGRNEAGRDALFAFLRSIGLHPLEWAEAVKATGKPLPYIGQILDAAFSTAQAVVVLLTPDDEARLKASLTTASDPPHETQLTGQARPNVLFEAGMAIARDQDRTVLVELGSLRPFSDIAGRFTIRLDNSTQRRQELAQRLAAAGCAVNREGTDWHTAGDFDAVLKAVEALSETVENAGSEPDTSVVGQLSDEAKQLLAELTKDDGSGAIVVTRTSGAVIIKVGRKSFGEPGNRRSEAKWEAAVNQLHECGLVQDPYSEGKYFEVTNGGFEAADELGRAQ